MPNVFNFKSPYKNVIKETIKIKEGQNGTSVAIMGEGLYQADKNQLVCGQYNEELTTDDSFFAVGVGSDDSHRRTMLAVRGSSVYVDGTLQSRDRIMAGHFARFGSELNEAGDYKLLVGRCNNPDANALLEVGNGSDNSHRSNAFVVLKDGRAKVSGAPVNDDDVTRKIDTSKVFVHHFDVNLSHDDLSVIPPGYRVDLNFNCISNNGEEYETLSDLDGDGYIVSAYGLLHQGAVPSTEFVFEAKLFYSSLNGGTLLLNINDIQNGTVSCAVVSGLNNYALEDSVSKI